MQDMQLEQAHLQMCQAVIRGNISRYETEYEERHAQAVKLHKAVNSGDSELYNQLMTVSSLEEQAVHSLNKNHAALEKPYFGRIDYTDKKLDRREQVYIGKNGIFKNKTEVLIADWRAPISSVYYENELGSGEYSLPDETTVSIDLKAKRTYDISGGSLNGFYDSDVASNDALLVKYLSRNKDVVLGEIIATIQKEQNAIIRESPFANLIVQGVAGSGKTTVAMHRISYLLYNYKERFESNEFCVIGSNDLLLNYITSGLPELDVPNIKHMRMDNLLVRLCEKSFTKRGIVVEPDSSARLRCTMNFIKELEYFLMQKRVELVDCRTLKDRSLGTILSESSNLTLLRENPHFSIYRLLQTMDERVKTRIRFLLSGTDKEIIQSKLKQYTGFYKNLLPKYTLFQYYDEFLEEWAKNISKSTVHTEVEQTINSVEKHLAACQERRYDIYDVAALALIHYRIFQKKPNEEFGLLFLDEAQDFGISIYYVLKQVLPDTYFTIMGDVSQNINYETGINDWYELTRMFLTEEKDKFLLLQKSYRNTIEISEYAGKILEKASFGRYKIKPVIRHGLPVQEEEFWSEPEMAERIAELLPQIQERGYTTSAVICKNEQESKKVRALLQNMGTQTASEESNTFLKGVMVLPIQMVKGLEFDAVFLWNPDITNGVRKPDTAKLLYVACTRALHELYVLQC